MLDLGAASGAVAMTKFGEAGMEKITPQMFGAKQDGVTDDSEALARSLLRALGGKSVGGSGHADTDKVKVDGIS